MWLLYIKLVAVIKARRAYNARQKQYLDEVIAKGGPDWQYLKRRIIVATFRGRFKCAFPSWWEPERKEWAARYAQRVQGITIYYDRCLNDYPITLAW